MQQSVVCNQLETVPASFFPFAHTLLNSRILTPTSCASAQEKSKYLNLAIFPQISSVAYSYLYYHEVGNNSI